MRWLSFAVLAVGVLALQVVLAPSLALWGAYPDWLLVLVVFYALHGRKPDCVLAAWIVGFCADLLTVERMGFLSLSYGLSALLVVLVRESLFKDRSTTQFATTLVVALMIHTTWFVYARLMYAPGNDMMTALVQQVVMRSAYTALFAPLLHQWLLRSPQLLGLARPRYAYRGIERVGGRRV